jgi:hypothetical protein
VCEFLSKIGDYFSISMIQHKGLWFISVGAII